MGAPSFRVLCGRVESENARPTVSCHPEKPRDPPSARAFSSGPKDLARRDTKLEMSSRAKLRDLLSAPRHHDTQRRFYQAHERFIA